jgi:hypothetical protein
MHYNNRRAVPTDVIINLSGVELSSDSWEFTAEVCVEPGGTGREMWVYMVQVLDHYPRIAAYYRNCLMQGAVPEAIDVDAGECEYFVHSFSFDPISMAQQEDIKIFAWVQEPLHPWPAEVHQAAKIQWPFAALFEDGFESGDASAWTMVVSGD